MGNVHTVTQIEPYRSWVGAALPIRPGHEDAVRLALIPRRPSYVAVEQAMRTLTVAGGTLTWPTGRWHITIQSGGKWGWDDLAPFLTTVAGDLAEACFFLDDEYAGFVEEYRIADGTLRVRRVVHEGGDTATYLATEVPECADFAYDHLAELIDEYGCVGGERLATALHRVHPDRWPTLAAAACAHSEGERWAEAVSAFTAAFAARGGLEPSPRLTAAHVRALSHTDPAAALHMARQYASRWRTDAPWALEMLAELEEHHGDRISAADALVESLRPAEDYLDTSENLYAGARVLALRGDLDVAADWLRVATMLRPSLAERAGAEPDLGSVIGVGPVPVTHAAAPEPRDDDPVQTSTPYESLDALLDAGQNDDAIQLVRDLGELGAALHLVERIAADAPERIGDALATVAPVPAAIPPLMHLGYSLGRTAPALAIYQAIIAIGIPATTQVRTLYLPAVNNAIIAAQAIGDLPLAVCIADQAQTYAAENPYIYHSAACVYALTGELDRAMEQVRLAVATRYEHLDVVAEDTDLDAIRDRPEFRELFSEARS
jgi:tetratricopeptide (TPR) repeat protein